MQRRHFLQTLGTAAVPAALAAQAAGAVSSESPVVLTMRSREPRVFLFDDGRHAAGLYQFEPPLTPADFTFTVDQLVNSGVDTLIYSAGLEGGVVLYDSRVAQKWGDNVTQWTHLVWYRAARIVQQLVADGHDPLKLLADRCHEKGLWFVASNWVDVQGGDRETYGGQGRKSDFAYDHPQFQVGEDKDPRAQHLSPTRFNLLHAEVRKERFLVFEEMLARYPTDGIELILAHPDVAGPYCRVSEVEQLAPVLTKWLGDLRDAARKAEQAQGCRKRIYVRIPADPSTWSFMGYDVPSWVSKKLVDGLICTTTSGMVDQDLDLSRAVALTRRTECRVLAGFSDTLGRQLQQYATPPMIWAAAANAYDQGADGFGLIDEHWSPKGWPWSHDEYQTLRFLGHPDLLATAEKLYRVRSVGRANARPSRLPGAAPPLPRGLTEGESAEWTLRVADELAQWHKLGRVKAVLLRVRFTNFQPSADEVKIELNGRPLPDSGLEKSDLTYRLWQMGAINPYGYVFDYRLRPEDFPKQGRNVVKVTLVKRDAKLKLPFDVYDIDLSIRYRLHRHFEQAPIEY
jgi:hypothetical protein